MPRHAKDKKIKGTLSQNLACVAWRFCRAGRTSGEAAQSPRGFSALARLYYLATKTAMLRRLSQNQEPF